MHALNVAALAAFAFVVTGCATVTRGRTQDFVINTTPSGATATLSTGETCTTPCTLTRPRNEEFSVTLTREGFEPSTHMIDHRTSGGGGTAMAGNVLVGGLIGAGVDAASGATQDLYPNPLDVTLVRVAVPAAAPAQAPEAAPAPAEAPAQPTS